MKYLKDDLPGDAECSQDVVKSSELLQKRLADLDAALAGGLAPVDHARALLDAAYILLDLERQDEAYTRAREAFDVVVPLEDWEQAVQACDVMSQTDAPDAAKALAHGVWLGVTYPIDPELSVAILQRLVEETPPKADGAAVAAAAARYIVDLRAEGKKRSDLQFFVAQLLGNVARQHSGVDSQELFDFWSERMQLDDPALVLSRLAKILDVLVPDAWWYDRDALRARLPAD
ncbi:MAG: hypothetical protein M0R77_08310 [Gammaproteobacteria bacterium]|nr:hypothetical protein [Gammaproteobacteria bacterium]